MARKILFIVLILALLTGCGPKTIKPGETIEINKTKELYFGVYIEDNSPIIQQVLQGKTEQEKIDFLIYKDGKYQVLPEEAIAALLADTVWITPDGVKVENPSVTLEPKTITWKETYQNEETTKSVEGYKLVIHANIIASADAKSGDVILKIPQFNTLELVGLYVVDVTGNFPNVVTDSDTYLVAVVK